MAYRPHSKVRIDPDAPIGASVCMRCGNLWNRTQLTYQHDWQGPRINNTRILVCPDCKDEYSNAKRTIVLPPDPLPVYNVRVEPFAINRISQWTAGPVTFYVTAGFVARLT
jgi:hypothetical protein